MSHRHRWLIGALVVVALAVTPALIVLGGAGSPAAGITIYVDADAVGPGNGGSWETAWTSLQDALAQAQDGDQIWVAAGTYTPSEESSPGDPRSATFHLKGGVAIYGGFDPSLGAVAWEQRDWATHGTILSGDIGTVGDASDNAYHVVSGPLTADLVVLNGFTIRDGYARDAVEHAHKFGGGLHAYGATLRLKDLWFEANEADEWGGGLYVNASNTTLDNVTFLHNSAGRGGGFCLNSSAATLHHVTFKGNTAGDGGGMYSPYSTAALTDCTFSENSADYGGGMYNDGSSPVVTDCLFAGNSARLLGGGMYNQWDSSPAVTNGTFSGNTAGQGGGMYNFNNSSPTLTNSTFFGNEAAAGGGMCNDDSSPTLANCTFSGNLAGPEFAGGMHNKGVSSPTLTNCILWGDSGQEIGDSGLSSSDVTYSDIRNGYTGEGNIDADPLFVDASNGDYHLGPASPCIDVGNNDAPYLPIHDFEGDPRILDGDLNGTRIVDMGVDEFGHAVYLPLSLRGY